MKLKKEKQLISESLNEFAARGRKPGSKKATIKKLDIDDDTDIEVGSSDEEWYGDNEEAEEVIDDINDIDFGDEITDEEEEAKEVLKTKLDRVEDYNTQKALLKQLKTIVDINKGKADKDKNYISFRVFGKTNDVIDGIPFDIKGVKDNVTISFIRRGTKNVKMVPIKDIILESKRNKLPSILNEYGSYEKDVENEDEYSNDDSDNFEDNEDREDFLFALTTELIENHQEFVMTYLDVEEDQLEDTDVFNDLQNALDDDYNYKDIIEQGIEDNDPEECANQIEDFII